MKLHDLRPAAGSRTPRTRVGRGIAAGGGKTAGRGTKGQKARAGSSIPPWFEGGQTPLHQRIPKLRGFRNPFKVEYEIVNLGRIAALVELGALEPGEPDAAASPSAARPRAGRTAASAPITVNQEILRAVGLVRTLDKPMKVLGQGEIDRPLFVVADAFSKSAVTKIEAAGGSVQVLQIPTGRLPALGVEPPAEAAAHGGPESPEASSQALSRTEAAETARPRPRAARPAVNAEPPAPAEPAAPAAAAAPTEPAGPAVPAAPAASNGPATGSGGKTGGGRGSARPQADDEPPARPAKPARPSRARSGARATTTTGSDSESASTATDDSPETPAGADA